MRRMVLVLAVVLLLGSAASAAQPWQILLQSSFGDSNRGGLHIAAPVFEMGQVFVETPGVAIAAHPDAMIYRSAVGAKVYPTNHPLYIGAAYWTTDLKDGAGRWDWLIGGRAVFAMGFTVEAGYAGANGLRLGIGASF